MSTSKGNQLRKRPQKHQNKTAFKNDLHDTSRKTKMLNSLEISGVCKRCKDIIDWKIKYKKYKPLTSPAKCVNCGEKAIKHAYHVLCRKCASDKKVCAKCCKLPNFQTEDEMQTSNHLAEENLSIEVQTILKTLPERKRRTLLRYLTKQGEHNVNKDIMALIEDFTSGVNIKMNDNEFNDDELSDELDSDNKK